MPPDLAQTGPSPYASASPPRNRAALTPTSCLKCAAGDRALRPAGRPRRSAGLSLLRSKDRRRARRRIFSEPRIGGRRARRGAASARAEPAQRAAAGVSKEGEAFRAADGRSTRRRQSRRRSNATAYTKNVAAASAPAPRPSALVCVRSSPFFAWACPRRDAAKTDAGPD